MTGTCLCGAVKVELDARPAFLNACNCTLCGKSGAVWAYCTPAEAKVFGPTKQFHRTDRETPAVNIHLCQTCGVTTHWTRTEALIRGLGNDDGMGVNARIFEPADLIGVELRFPDGRAWSGKGPFGYRRPAEILGESGI